MKSSKLYRRFKRQRTIQGRRFRRLRAHPIMVPVITFSVLLVITFGAWLFMGRHETRVQDAYVVIISHDHSEQTVPSKERTVGTLLKRLAIKLNQGDVVEPAVNTKIDQDNFRVNIYRAVPVEIVDGDKHTYTFSAATTSRSIAKQAGIETSAEDTLTTKPVDNFVSQQAIGQQVIINRATPVNLNLYGTPTMIKTHAKTVGELVKEKAIKLARDDQLVPAADTVLTGNLQVFISRNGTKIESVTQPIATPIQVINDPSLAFGTSAVRQQGSAGEQVVTYQVQLVNNLEVGRTVIQQVVTRPAVAQIEVHGSAVPSTGDIKGLIVYWAQQYGVDPNYLLSVARCESNFHTDSVNASGAYGLFQYKQGTWANYSAAAGVGGASIWDGGAQAHTTAWAFAHGKSSAWSCA